MLDLALVHMVVMCFGIGVLIHWGEASFAPADTRPMLTWVGPIILITAAIVPANPMEDAARRASSRRRWIRSA